MNKSFLTVLCTVASFTAVVDTVVNVLPPREAAKQKVTVEVESAPIPAAHPPRTVAMIVQNHAGPAARIPMLAMTDALTAKLSGHGFRVINPYNAFGDNQNRTQKGEKTPTVSAMDMARKLKADGAITASVLDFLDSTLGTPPKIHQYSIRISLNLADAQTGATICGETIKVMSPKYTINQVKQNRQEYLGDLVHSAAEECAQRLEDKARSMNWEPTPPPPPPQPKKIIPSGPLTISDVDRAVSALVASMRENPVFRTNYDKAESSIGHKPLLIIGGLVDMTNDKSPVDDVANLLAAEAQSLRMTLLDSHLFDVKDDDIITTLTKRIIASGNSPLEDGELMSVLKQHGSPDFYLAGDLRYFVDGGHGKYRLHLALHDIHTGKIVWEDVHTVVKALGSSVPQMSKK